MACQPQKRLEQQDLEMNPSEPPDSSEIVVRRANEEVRQVRSRAKNLASFVRRKFTPIDGTPAARKGA